MPIGSFINAIKNREEQARQFDLIQKENDRRAAEKRQDAEAERALRRELEAAPSKREKQTKTELVGELSKLNERNPGILSNILRGLDPKEFPQLSSALKTSLEDYIKAQGEVRDFNPKLSYDKTRIQGAASKGIPIEKIAQDALNTYNVSEAGAKASISEAGARGSTAENIKTEQDWISKVPEAEKAKVFSAGFTKPVRESEADKLKQAILQTNLEQSQDSFPMEQYLKQAQLEMLDQQILDAKAKANEKVIQPGTYLQTKSPQGNTLQYFRNPELKTWYGEPAPTPGVDIVTPLNKLIIPQINASGLNPASIQRTQAPVAISDALQKPIAPVPQPILKTSPNVQEAPPIDPETAKELRALYKALILRQGLPGVSTQENMMPF